MSEFFGDTEKITYPEADRIVDAYIDARGAEKGRATSRDVLNWSEAPDNRHNQRRVHDALTRRCVTTEANWAGRTVFELPATTTEP